MKAAINVYLGYLNIVHFIENFGNMLTSRQKEGRLHNNLKSKRLEMQKYQLPDLEY